jgi:hypothetical protein
MTHIHIPDTAAPATAAPDPMAVLEHVDALTQQLPEHMGGVLREWKLLREADRAELERLRAIVEASADTLRLARTRAQADVDGITAWLTRAGLE